MTTYSEQTITDYLLGSLSEKEALRLDELSFTEEEFAEKLNAAENDLVDAYVLGELSGPTLEQFKSVYLASPLRREKVRFATALHQFAELATTQTTTASLELPKKSATSQSGLLSALKFLSIPRPAVQWGLAAAVFVLLVAGGLLMQKNSRLREEANLAQAKRGELQLREQQLQSELASERSGNAESEKELARVRQELEQREREEEKQKGLVLPGKASIASFILTPQMRGAEQLPTVAITDRTGYVAMQLQLEPNNYSIYRVMLAEQSGQQILWQSGKVKARTIGGRKSLSVHFRAGLLKRQTYMLRVSGVTPSGASEIISDYPFKVAEQE